MPPRKKCTRIAQGVYLCEGVYWLDDKARRPDGSRATIRRKAEVQSGDEADLDAQRELRRRKKLLGEGRLTTTVMPKSWTVGNWASHVRGLKPAKAESLRVWWGNASHWLEALGEMDMRAVTASDVRSVWKEVLAKGHAYGTLKNVRSTLRFVFKEWVDEHGGTNPVQVAKCHLPPKKTVANADLDSDTEKLRQVFLALGPGSEPWVYHVLLWATGMRGEELRCVLGAHLIRRDDGPWLSIPQGKTGSREVPLSDLVLSLLEHHRREQGIVSELEPLFGRSAATYRTQWRKAHAGMLPGAHKLRGAFETRCERMGVRPKVYKAVTGHADSNTSERHYLGVDRAEKWEAMNLVSEVVSEVVGWRFESEVSPQLSPQPATVQSEESRIPLNSNIK